MAREELCGAAQVAVTSTRVTRAYRLSALSVGQQMSSTQEKPLEDAKLRTSSKQRFGRMALTNPSFIFMSSFEPDASRTPPATV